jgi:DNA-binding PadR family transcriptional regulator
MRRHHRPHRHHHRHGRHRHGFDAWSASWAGGGRFFGPGEVRLALLSLLSGGSRHGYDLMKRLEARSGGMYKASAGTVYPTLQQLEDEGLVVSEAKEGKRVYQLTEAGRRELDEHAPSVERIWRRADEWGEWGHAAGPETWEIARPAMRLVKAAMRAVANARDSERIDQVRDILELTSEELEALENTTKGP